MSVKLPLFDGKASKFTMFWMRFKAYGAVKGFLPALQDGGEADMPADETTTLDPADADEAKQIAAKKRNAVAVASLTMAFTTQALMKHVGKACDEDWPGDWRTRSSKACSRSIVHRTPSPTWN